MAMMRSTGVLAMGAGDRTPTKAPIGIGRGRHRGLRPHALPDGDRGRRSSSRWQAPIVWPCRPIKAAAGTVKAGLDPGSGRLATGRGRRGTLARGTTSRPDSTGSRSPPTTISSGCRPTPRTLHRTRRQAPRAPRGRPPCRPGGRSTLRRSATRSGWPPHTPESRSSSQRTGWRPTTTTARIAYTQGALEGLAQCMDDGLDVRGYIHWTLLDNFEWNAGYLKDLRPHRRRP